MTLGWNLGLCGILNVDSLGIAVSEGVVGRGVGGYVGEC